MCSNADNEKWHLHLREKEETCSNPSFCKGIGIHLRSQIINSHFVHFTGWKKCSLTQPSLTILALLSWHLPLQMQPCDTVGWRFGHRYDLARGSWIHLSSPTAMLLCRFRSSWFSLLSRRGCLLAFRCSSELGCQHPLHCCCKLLSYFFFLRTNVLKTSGLPLWSFIHHGLAEIRIVCPLVLAKSFSLLFQLTMPFTSAGRAGGQTQVFPRLLYLLIKTASVLISLLPLHSQSWVTAWGKCARVWRQPLRWHGVYAGQKPEL